MNDDDNKKQNGQDEVEENSDENKVLHEKKKLKNKEDDVQVRIDDLEEQLKRSVADYRNLQKRFDEEKREFLKFANKDLLLELLPAFDNLFLAEKHVEDQGLKLTLKMLFDTFERIGVKRIKAEGESYNPEVMECIATEEGEDNKVLAELRPGFMLHDRVLRPAQVKVGKKN